MAAVSVKRSIEPLNNVTSHPRWRENKMFYIRFWDKTKPLIDLFYIQLFQEHVLKNVYVTIPVGNIGNDQYTVSDNVVDEPTFVAFLWHFQTYLHGFLCHFNKLLEEQWNQNHPQYLSELLCGLFADISRNLILYTWNLQVQAPHLKAHLPVNKTIHPVISPPPPRPRI